MRFVRRSYYLRVAVICVYSFPVNIYPHSLKAFQFNLIKFNWLSVYLLNRLFIDDQHSNRI